jgi:hypothetical protein
MVPVAAKLPKQSGLTMKSKSAKRRLNVHYALDESGWDYCVRINTGIRRITESLIRFGHEPDSAIPHITLVMGTLHESTRIETLARAVNMISDGARRCSFRIGRPYISRLNGRYVLSDLEPDPSFLDLQASLESVPSSHMDLSASVDKGPHITLAYITTKHTSVRDYLLAVPADLEIVGRNVEISDVAANGTCINTLFSIGL